MDSQTNLEMAIFATQVRETLQRIARRTRPRPTDIIEIARADYDQLVQGLNEAASKALIDERAARTAAQT